jgi:beta-aspartyl-peptidase (threonine type)
MEHEAMTTRRRWAGALVVAPVILPGLAALGQARDADWDRAVRAVLERQVADWNRGDLDGFLSGYWKSPKVVFQSGGERFDGWEAMRERYRRRYQAEGRAMGRLEFSELDVEALGPQAALARGRWRLAMPDGTRPGGLFTVIFRKLPEGWKIVHDHTSVEEAKPAAAVRGIRPGPGSLAQARFFVVPAGRLPDH